MAIGICFFQPWPWLCDLNAATLKETIKTQGLKTFFAVERNVDLRDPFSLRREELFEASFGRVLRQTTIDQWLL